MALSDGRNEVGKALTCKVCLDGEGISKVHAVITVDGAGVFVEDMNSTNKSMLGSLEEPVELVPGQKYPMEHGDVVVFGDVACVFLWRAMQQGNSVARSINTAPPGLASAANSMHSPMRPQTTAFAGDFTQEDVLGQLETLMQGMSQLYSIVQGAPQSPTTSNLASTRPGTHVSSSYAGTRATTAHQQSMSMADQSSVSFALDRSDLPHYSPYRQNQPNLSLAASQAVGFRGLDRAGANLQGTGGSSSQALPIADDAPLPGLHRHAPQAPLGPELTPADFMHLYAGVSRGGTTAGSRPRTEQRPITSISTSPALSDEMVRFGRFRMPEKALMNILKMSPRIPVLLRLSCVSPYLRRLCSHDSLWDELDVSWDTLAPDPICNIMTGQSWCLSYLFFLFFSSLFIVSATL